MPIQQGTRSCSICGAITTIQISEDNGQTWQGPDNEEKHAEWHARITAALSTLAARQDGIPPWNSEPETGEDPF